MCSDSIIKFLAQVCSTQNHFNSFIVHTLWRETFEGENFHGSGKSDHFTEKTFAECKNLT